MSRTLRLLAVAAAICLLTDHLNTGCQAAGIWNMPSNLRQTMGMGFGPGYHAPMVKNYWFTSKLASQPVKRVLRSPQASSCPGGFCGLMTSLEGGQPGESHLYHVQPSYHAPVPSQPPMYHQQSWQAVPRPSASQSVETIKRPLPQPPKELKILKPKKKANGQELKEPASPSDGPRPESLPLPRD